MRPTTNRSSALPVPRTGAARRRRPARVLAVGAPALLALGWLTGCAATAVVHEGTLYISGTPDDDVIGVRLQPGNDAVIEVDFGRDGAIEHTIDRSTFDAVFVLADDGDDDVVLDATYGVFTTTHATTVLAGAGADTIFGQHGAETLDGEGGDDFIDGYLGVDAIRGGEGDDEVAWGSGGASDVVDGGPGSDLLRFGGASTDENVGLTAEGASVRLSRDIDGTVVQVDAVEAVALRTLHGADSVAVGDLSATALRQIDVDFSGGHQVEDGARDEVVLPHTALVGHDGDTPIATSNGTTVRIANASSGSGNGAIPGDRFRLLGGVGDDTVRLEGTAGAEAASLSPGASELVVGGMTGRVYTTIAAVEHLDVDLAGGDDSFAATGNLAAVVGLRLVGGAGADTIHGSNGTDVIDGGPGTDVVDGGIGADQIQGGTDADLFIWDPGDGSDVIDGGNGADQMLVNGSSGSEAYELSSTGSLVRLTRNLGSIAHILTQIEAVAVKAGNGNDVVAIRDLTGSGVSSVQVDLGSFSGGSVSSDGFSDVVTVDGTAQADAIAVTASADRTQVSVDGLPAAVQVIRPDPALDRLTVAGLGGTDSLTASPDATLALFVELLP